MAGNGENIAQSSSCTSFIYITITRKQTKQKQKNSNDLFLCILNEDSGRNFMSDLSLLHFSFQEVKIVCIIRRKNIKVSL